MNLGLFLPLKFLVEFEKDRSGRQQVEYPFNSQILPTSRNSNQSWPPEWVYSHGSFLKQDTA